MKRSEQIKENTWDLTLMYSDIEEWKEKYKEIKVRLETLNEYNGNLCVSSTQLREALNLYVELAREVSNLYVYTHLWNDTNLSDDESRSYYDKATALYVDFGTISSYIEPELMNLTQEQFEVFVEESPQLEEYRRMIERIFQEKEHVLSKEEEALLAQVSEIFGASGDSYKTFTNTNLEFGPLKTESGEEIPFIESEYMNHLTNTNRTFRKQAYQSMFTSYKKYNNLLSNLYVHHIKGDIARSKVRNYTSTRAAKLTSKEIPEKVYDNLLTSIHDALPTLQHYLEIRKKTLGIEKLEMFDLYVPLVSDIDKKYSFEEASEHILSALEPLGKDYQEEVQHAFTKRWIDRYPNEGKRSGAYSSGSYQNAPYILMNYTNRINDMFTLAHELGHSMHSLYSDRYQNYVNAQYVIFVAEVASTVNELLLNHYLFEQATTDKERKYILNYRIEQFRLTVFRQSMFAEFEHKAHTYVEEHSSATKDVLNRIYKELNTTYYQIEDETDFIQYEWSRIPHFYGSFYVYQYATSFCAAVNIARRILANEEGIVEKYRTFLTLGCSKSPLELLNVVDIDLSTRATFDAAFEEFKHLVEQFESL